MSTLLKYVEDKERIFIYGTGKKGRNIRFYLEHYIKNIKIAGYIVSKGQKHENKLDDIPVYELSEYEYKENDGMIIAMDSAFYEEVIPGIINKACRDVYFVKYTEDVTARVLSKLSELGVDLDGEILDLGSFKVPNLFNSAKDEMETLIIYSLEFFDLVLPYMGDDSLIDEGIYEFEKAVLEEDDIVIDCGANIGMFAARAAALGGTVFAFEPAPQAMKYLDLTQEMYKDRIINVPYALAEEKGVTYFDLSNVSIGAGTMVADEFNPLGIGNGNEKIQVQVTTIDDFVKENNIEKVDFIKADIEGAERLMLMGAQETLKKFAPKLSLCTYHRWDDVSVMTNLILKANPNYKIVYAWKKLYAWVEA